MENKYDVQPRPVAADTIRDSDSPEPIKLAGAGGRGMA